MHLFLLKASYALKLLKEQLSKSNPNNNVKLKKQIKELSEQNYKIIEEVKNMKNKSDKNMNKKKMNIMTKQFLENKIEMEIF